MGNRSRRLLALVAYGFVSCGLLGLTGCVGTDRLPLISRSSPAASTAAAAPPANLVQPLTNSTLDGSGPGEGQELPMSKKVEVCLATAKMMEKAGKLGEAIHYYEQIRELDPRRDLMCTRHLAVLYDKKGNFDKALDEYHRLLKANPRDADAYNDLGYGYYNRGLWEPAEKNLRVAVECDPKHKRAWSNLGMTLAQQARYAESLAAFEHVVSRPQAMCNIGFIQAGQGRKDLAREAYAYALKLEPGLQKARQALEALNEYPSKSARDQERRDMRKRAEMAGGGFLNSPPNSHAGGETNMLTAGPIMEPNPSTAPVTIDPNAAPTGVSPVTRTGNPAPPPPVPIAPSRPPAPSLLTIP